MGWVKVSLLLAILLGAVTAVPVKETNPVSPTEVSLMEPVPEDSLSSAAIQADSPLASANNAKPTLTKSAVMSEATVAQPASVVKVPVLMSEPIQVTMKLPLAVGLTESDKTAGAMKVDSSSVPAVSEAPPKHAPPPPPPVTINMDNPGEQHMETIVIPDGQAIPKAPISGESDKVQKLPPPLAPHKANKDMLIAVVSSPGHYFARRAIRKSYMMTAKYLDRVDVKFFVGQLPNDFPNREQADKDITAEEDLVRLYDFTESYHNLSYKALDIFKYAADGGYKSVFKVDDDTYVRVPLALQFFDTHQGDPYLYGGDFVNGEKAMVTDPNSKWYMKDQYPHDRLEDYANGPGVMLGEQALHFFKDNYSKLFRYRVDDAAIGIWLKDMPMHKVPMSADSYSYHIHGETVWVNPVNSEEMIAIHQGQADTLQVCHETCLCWGGPMPADGNCLNWGEFMSAGYKDLIPRLAFVQTSAEVTTSSQSSD